MKFTALFVLAAIAVPTTLAATTGLPVSPIGPPPGTTWHSTTLSHPTTVPQEPTTRRDTTTYYSRETIPGTPLVPGSSGEHTTKTGQGQLTGTVSISTTTTAADYNESNAPGPGGAVKLTNAAAPHKITVASSVGFAVGAALAGAMLV